MEYGADISVPSGMESELIVTTKSAHFSFEVFPECQVEDKFKQNVNLGKRILVPTDFDSKTEGLSMTNIIGSDVEYDTPYDRFRLCDDHGNVYTHWYPYWYNHLPVLRLKLPQTLHGSTLKWLLEDGIEMIMILELKQQVKDSTSVPHEHVLCLGLDRREPVVRRFGMFCLPKAVWEKARPDRVTVTLG
jgi:hypothetical protein